jgi:hypothetical protein
MIRLRSLITTTEDSREWRDAPFADPGGEHRAKSDCTRPTVLLLMSIPRSAQGPNT